MLRNKIKIVEPGFYIPFKNRDFDNLSKRIEWCGRICYKSEKRITENSADKFVKKLIKSGHESVLEHGNVTVIIVCSRACSHQLVRHRLCAYSQESMRYCNYSKSKELQVICPPEIRRDKARLKAWEQVVKKAYKGYLDAIRHHAAPGDARFLLPNATKTELAVTANLRTWRHMIRERGLNKRAQWEIRGIFQGILQEFAIQSPSIFGDLL